MSTRPPVVLLIDDHQDTLAMYAIGLLAMGFHPLTADGVQDGFACACGSHPDAIVADVMLRDGSGLDLARRLRDDARTRHTPVIVLTGYSLESVQQQARDAGCDRIVEKPCLPDALAVEIRDAINGRLRDRQAIEHE